MRILQFRPDLQVAEVMYTPFTTTERQAIRVDVTVGLFVEQGMSASIQMEVVQSAIKKMESSLPSDAYFHVSEVSLSNWDQK